MTEGKVPVPHTAPALSDDDVAPVYGLSPRRSHSHGDETPFERIRIIEHVYRVIIYNSKKTALARDFLKRRPGDPPEVRHIRCKI